MDTRSSHSHILTRLRAPRCPDARNGQRARAAVIVAGAALVAVVALTAGPSRAGATEAGSESTTAIAARAAPGVPAPGVDPGTIGGLASGRVIEISTRGMHTTVATARVYSRVAGHWRELRGPVDARIGAGGLSWPDRRREGDGTTPIGDYGFVYGFGSRANPGLQGLAWRMLDPGACWSQVRAHYNRWIERTPCPAADEDLWASAAGAYRYAAVIDFNYRRPVYPRGSGIFLHDQTGGPTAGCVSLAEPDLLFVLRWMRPGTRILIGPYTWLRSLRATR